MTDITAEHGLSYLFERQRPQSWFSWTVRGFCILLLFSYFLLLPVRNEFDIVATVIVSCVGFLLLLTACGTLLLGIINRSSLTISNGVPASLPVFSGAETTILFDLNGLRLFPFFTLTMRAEFETEDIDPLSVTISARGYARRTSVFLPIVFPHRGNWRFKKISWSLSDEFDLWRFSRVLESDSIHAVIPVSPAPGYDSPPPIINSTLRDGDTITDIQESRGDYYDMKQYHPSDGMRKIIWKIYARTGELLARHPEKTMTPEGRVLMLVCAQSVHDAAARLAVNYCGYVCDAGLECAAVCVGQKDGKLERNPQELEKSLIETAWSSNSPSPDEHTTLLNLLTAQSAHGTDTVISHIIVVGDLTATPAGYYELLKKAGEKVVASNLTPVFLLAAPIPPRPTSAAPSRLSAFIRKLFFEAGGRAAPAGEQSKFLEAAARSGWDVYRVFP